ncbi:MAG: hypothetical protein ACR2L0_03750 [Gaiellaceae bacterium]
MSGACRRRWLLASSTACSVLALAACGGETRSETEPTFPTGVGSSLAADADRVASRLEAGDAEGARSAALELDAAVEQAIAVGRVPSELRGPLREAVDAIVASVPTPAPAPTTTAEEPDDDEDNGNGNGKGRDKDKDEQDDDDD